MMDPSAEEAKEFLVMSVEQRKIIYDASSTSNRNKFLKQKAWEEVADETGQNVNWCMTEFKKLKDSYRKKKKQIIGKTGQARKKIEQWPYFQSLMFLDDYLVASSTSGNLDTQIDDEQIGLDSQEESQTESEPPSPDVVADPTYSRKRHKSSVSKKVDEAFLRYLNESKDTAKDEFYYFGQDIAAQLRKMPPDVAAFAKFQVSKTLFECKVQQPSVMVIQATTNPFGDTAEEIDNENN